MALRDKTNYGSDKLPDCDFIFVKNNRKLRCLIEQWPTGWGPCKQTVNTRLIVQTDIEADRHINQVLLTSYFTDTLKHEWSLGSLILHAL